MTQTVTQPAGDVRVSYAGTVRSEWIKLWSLRSNVVMVALIVIAMLGLCTLVTLVNGHLAPTPFGGGAATDYPDLTDLSLAGAGLAELVAGVFGVLVVTNEYATGMIRATFTAQPRRLSVLSAKLLVCASTFLSLNVVLCFASFFLGQALSGSTPWVPHPATISEPHVLREILTTACYETLILLLGMGLGWIIRNTAGALASLFGLQLVLPVIVFAIPSETLRRIGRALPSPLPGESGFSMTHIHDLTGVLTHPFVWWVGALVVLTYVVVASVIGAFVVTRRDA